MYDDGLHVDGAAGDGVWGCLNRAPRREGMFGVDVYTEDLAEGILRRLPNAALFTTAGPLEFQSFAPIRTSANLVTIDQPAVRNRGSAFLIPDVTVTIRKLERDTVIDRIYNFRIPFGDIGPDSAVATWRFYSLTLKPVVPDTVLLELAADFASGGVVFWSDTLSSTLGPVVGIAGEQFGIPAEFELSQNYPNPFNPSTTIRYGLPSRSHVTLTVFNILGQQVATLVEGEMEAGYHEAVFDASRLASGVYLYRLQAGDFVQTKRLVLLR